MKKSGGSGSKAPERAVQSVPKGLDHLVYVAPDLEQGMDEIERLLGVRPAPGGRHPAFGTRNALLSLGPATYLEVIAPDPTLPRPKRGIVFGADALEQSRLATWVLRAESIVSLAARAKASGLDLGVVRSATREKPDGTVMSWKLTDPYAPRLDGVVPFLIAWGATPHPARGAASLGEVVDLRIEHPKPAAVRKALRTLGVDMPVEASPVMALIATIRMGTRLAEIS